MSVPAGYAADITGTGSNSRRCSAGFTLGTETVQIKSKNVTVTITNSTESAADLYIFGAYAENGSVKIIRIYDPNAVVTHDYSVNFKDGIGNIVKADAISGTIEEGAEYTFSLPKAFKDDSDNYWVLSESEGRTDFSETETMGTSDATLNYTYVKDNTIIYYNELSETPFPTASNGGAAEIGTITTDELATGLYSVEIHINATLSAATRDVSVYLGDVNMAKYENTGIKTTALNLVSATSVKFGHDSGRSNYVDYIIIRRTGDAVSSQSATISSPTGYATFCSQYALDFSEVTGLTAWIAKSLANDVVTMEKVEGIVAAGTGLVIKGSTTSIPTVNTGTDFSATNKLIGVTTGSQEVTAGNYVLSVQGGKAVFALVDSNLPTVTAGHAYLSSSVAGARTLQIVFDDETTGISAALNDKGQMINDKFVYNLQGQRVNQPTKGLYIMNGKKYIVK